VFQALELLEPYGMANPEPVFAARGVQLTAPPRIMKEKHIKLKLRQNHVVTAAPAVRPSKARLVLMVEMKNPHFSQKTREMGHPFRTVQMGTIRGVTFDLASPLTRWGWHMRSVTAESRCWQAIQSISRLRSGTTTTRTMAGWNWG